MCTKHFNPQLLDFTLPRPSSYFSNYSQLYALLYKNNLPSPICTPNLFMCVEPPTGVRSAYCEEHL